MLLRQRRGSIRFLVKHEIGNNENEQSEKMERNNEQRKGGVLNASRGRGGEACVRER
jgi:hypothetical protein